MSIFSKLRRTPKKNSTMVFIDYEYWFYSFQTLYQIKPNPLKFRKDLEEKYSISDIMVFGDFSHEAINQELVKIREITNTIIETQNTDSHRRKDMTDFIMLDYIYQTAAQRPNIKTYIIFTGDGHFHSVAKYLSQKLRKNVVIYGVRGSVSKSLKSTTETVVELPGKYDLTMPMVNFIMSNFKYVEEHSDIIPTAKTTAAAISKRQRVPESEVSETLSNMIEDKIIIETEREFTPGRPVKVLSADWKAFENLGLGKKSDIV